MISSTRLNGYPQIASKGWTECVTDSKIILGDQRKLPKTNYDASDIAGDLEASHKECNCIIHSKGRQPLKVEGYMAMWFDD